MPSYLPDGWELLEEPEQPQPALPKGWELLGPEVEKLRSEATDPLEKQILNKFPKYEPDLTDFMGGVRKQSQALGMNPEHYLTGLLYESPDIEKGNFWQQGPRTKWGQHRGMFQWGEPQAAQYGVHEGMTAAEQLEAGTRYLTDRGFKPGMDLYDFYSTINAGAPGRYDRSDRPGETVASHVDRMLRERLPRAQALLAAYPEKALDMGEDATGALPEGWSLVEPKPTPATAGEHFARGVDITQKAGYDFAQWFGQVTGSKEIEDWGKSGSTAEGREIANQKQLQDPLEIESLAQAGEFLKGVFAEQAPIMAGPMAGGLTGAAIGTAIAPGPGTLIGGVLGAFVPSFALSTGMVQGTLEEKGVESAPGWVFIGGTAVAALDTVMPGKVGTMLVRKFGAEAAEEIAEKFLTRTAKGIGKGMAIEGGTEFTQEIFEEVAAAQGADAKIDWPSALKQGVTAGIAGGVMGGTIGGVSAAVPGKPKVKAEDIQAEAGQEAEPPQQALPNVIHMPDQSMGPQVVDAPEPVSPERAQRSLDILRAAGYQDEDIRGMEPEELAEAVREAEDAGLTPQPIPPQAAVPEAAPEGAKLPDGWQLVSPEPEATQAQLPLGWTLANEAGAAGTAPAPSIPTPESTPEGVATVKIGENPNKVKAPPLDLTAPAGPEPSQGALPLTFKKARIGDFRDGMSPLEAVHRKEGLKKLTGREFARKHQPERTFDEVYAVAPKHQDTLARVGDELTRLFPDVGFINPGIKKREKAEGKIARKGYSGTREITDIVRASFTATKPEPANSIVEELGKRFEILDEGWSVTPVGYFDRKVLIKFDDGTVGEIQILEPSLATIKNGEAHALYDESAKLSNDDPRKAEIDAQMRERFYKPALSRLGPEWRELLDAEWGKLFAESAATASAGSAGVGPNVEPKSSGESTRADMPTSVESTRSQEPDSDSAQATPGAQTAGRPSQEQKTGEDLDTRKDIEPAPEKGKSDDDIDDAIDAAIQGAFPKKPSTKGELAASAAKSAGRGVSKAAEGLAELFSPKGKAALGIGWSPETWEKAKPLFIEAAKDFKVAAEDIAELARLLVEDLRDRLGLKEEAIDKMRPYLKRFIREVRRGEIKLGAEKAEGTLEERLVAALRAGKLTDRIALMRFLKGTEGEAWSAKEKEEFVELALVKAARQIIEEGQGEAATFKALVELYNNQPRLASRTSTSVSEQAYSTPLPLAYLASRLAGVADAKRVYEPSAGNGALLIEADPNKALANELNEDRAAALRGQAFTTSTKDATAFKPPGEYDSVIMNPPFGAVREGGRSKIWHIPIPDSTEKLTTSQIDHAIAMQGLQAMTKDGKAVLILGGIKARSHEEMRKGYRGAAKRTFFYHLYNHYNVVDHFQVDGKLYERQGAGWPVDVVVIDGRGKSKRDLPAANPPTILETWDALEAKLPQRNAATRDRPDAERPSQGRPAPGDVTAPVEQPGAGRPTRGEDTGEQRPVEREPRSGAEPAPSRPSSDPGQPAAPGVVLEPEKDVRPREQSGDDRGTAGGDRPRRNGRANLAGQVPYKPKAKLESSDTVLPQNLETPTQAMLDKVEDANGDIIDFVARETGFTRADIEKNFYAEGIDAAGALLTQLKQGNGFILGDQTGIGKTRPLILSIAWAIKNGHKPVLITAKPDLYADLLNEMDAVGFSKVLGGRKPRVFMTNKDDVPLDAEAVEWKAAADAAEKSGEKRPQRKGRFLNALKRKDYLQGLQDLAAGKDNFDFVATTYSQLQTVKGGAETERRHLMRALADRAFVILDETHKAGGEGVKDPSDRFAKFKQKGGPSRAQFIREILKNVPGVVYSSATYAKRPEVMDLFFRTDIGKAVDDINKLPGLIKRGGVPMQQVVAAKLAEAGQYLRRERSFEGVEYAHEVVPIRPEAYAQMAKTIRTIFRFDLQAKTVREELQEELDTVAGLVAQDHAVGGAGASSTNFASVMHNIVNQMLLAIKADAVSDRAIKAHQDGEKPIIALYNTMESFLDKFMQEEGIGLNKPIEINFGDLLKRYLARTLRVRENKPGGQVKIHNIDPSNLPPDMQRLYREALDLIDAGDYSALPVSPIDHMRMRLTKAGIKVTEITGRKTMLDYAKGIAVARPNSELGVSGKQATKIGFQKGKIDAIILNTSGAEGISLHADKASDKKPRRMIIAQAAPNIDDHLQILGRIHRTGQIVKPAYSQFAADIPAEARPAAVLMKKMASLNANTTGARKSALSSDAVDFINEIGDEVAEQIIDNDPTLEMEMNYPLGAPDKKDRQTDAAKKVTGRIMLLDPQPQEELINRIQEAYRFRLKELEDSGESPLEAKTLDLQARQLDVQTLKERTGDSPFLDGVYVEKVSAKAQGRAMSMAEIDEATAKVTPDQHRQEAANINQIGYKWIAEEVGNHKAESQAGVRRRYEADLQRWRDTHNHLRPGSVVTLKLPIGELQAVVLEMGRQGKAKMPFALGSWRVKFAVPDGARTMEFSFNSLFAPGHPKGDERGAEFERSWVSRETVGQAFEEARKEGRETRFIFTGNILAGFEQANGQGQIINYTDEHGDVKPGILMPRGFDLGKFNKQRKVKFKSAEQIQRFLYKAPEGVAVLSADEHVKVYRNWSGWNIETSSGRATGGRYYTDPEVRKALGGREMVRRGSLMRVSGLSDAEFKNTVQAMQNIGAAFETKEQQDIAEQITRGEIALLRQMGTPNSIYEVRHGQPVDYRGKAPADFKIKAPYGVSEAALRNEVEEALALIKRVAGDVPVKTEPTVPLNPLMLYGIDVMDAQAVKAVLGMHDHYPAAPWKSYIALAMDSRTWGREYMGMDLITTASHEVWHHVEYALLIDQERALLQREKARVIEYALPEVERIHLKGNKLSKEQVESFPFIEYTAIAFQRYRREMEEPQRAGATGLMESRGLHSGIRAIFQRIMAALANIRLRLSAKGIHRFEQLFDMALAGKFAPRRKAFEPVSSEGIAREVARKAYPDVAFMAGMRTIVGAPTASLATRTGGLSWLDKRRIELQDKMLAFKRLEQNMGISGQLSTYLASRLYPGKTGEQLEDIKTDFVDPMVEAMRKAEISFEDMSDYLQARHARERNALIRQRDPGNPNGSGWSDAEAATILSEVRRSGKQNVYDQVARLHDQMLEQTRKTLLKAGLISREQFDEWQSLFAHYTPLRGFETGTEEVEFGGTGWGFDVRGPESKHALGRRDKADNSLAYAVQQAQSAIIRAEKNRVNRVLLRAVETHPNPNVWRVFKGEAKRRLNPVTNRVETYWVPPQYVRQENIFGVKIGGKMKYIELVNPRLATAMRGVGASIQNPIIRAMMSVARVFAAMQTQWNPNFVLTNVARDLQTAMINLGDVENLPPATRSKVLAEAISLKAIRGIISALRGKGTSPYAHWFDEYRLAGGKISFIESNDIERIKKRINTSINEGKVRSTLRKAGQLISDLNTAAENGVRLSVYIALRKAGVAKDKAAFVARDLTVDFNLHGEMGPAINAMYVFFNASLQGSVRMARAVATSRKVQAAMVGIMATGVALEVLNALLAGDDDDDGKNDYDEIPDFIKERHMIIMLGSGNGYIKIPLPYGYSLPYLAGQQAMAVIRGAQKPLKAAEMVGLSLLDSFNPLGMASSFWQVVSPTLLDPGVQMLENKAWYGGPIYPQKFDRNKPDAETYFNSAPEWAKTIADTLNKATGGNKGRSGYWDVSPETIEHMTQFVTGGVGRFVMSGIKTGQRMMAGEEWLPEATPFLQRFYDTRTSESDRREFYETWDEVDAAYYEFNTLRKAQDSAGATETRNTYGAELQVYRTFKKTREVLKEIRDRKDKIEENQSLSAAERRQQIDDLTARERDLIARALAAYRRAKK